MINPFTENKNEILYNLVNAGIAGGLVFIGAFADGEITKLGIIAALVAAGLVILTKFKDYWSKQESEYSTKLFNFLT